MADRVIVDIVGVRVKVVASELSPGALREQFGHLVVGMPADCTLVADGADLEEVLAAAVRLAIERAPGLLLHAGAVSRDGRAVLFPGESGTGKSTMTAACVQRGLDYVTDEMVALEIDSLAVAGFARPIMLTGWAATRLGLDVPGIGGKLSVTPELLGGATVPGTVRAAHVVSLRHGGAATSLEPMTAGETLTALLRASFNHYRHGERAWSAAAELASSVQGWRLDFAELAPAVDAVEAITSSAVVA